MYPHKMAIQEIKKNKQLIKEAERLSPKVNIYPFMYASYIFLIIISIMYIAILYLIIGGIFIEPLAFICLVPTIINTLGFNLIFTKIYSKKMKNYLKTIVFYNVLYELL